MATLTSKIHVESVHVAIELVSSPCKAPYTSVLLGLMCFCSLAAVRV